ncbi:unnamed protein product [Callosobruchus maculatus]|uniref:Cyclic nucleotide-binding domain-containing protein n=1 Tax=Callosobruchus maculatus TaxID=64391 RepID=A0A653DI62_CALMS|nr:unnamed protein product [Callosobruchus maculatus]
MPRVRRFKSHVDSSRSLSMSTNVFPVQEIFHKDNCQIPRSMLLRDNGEILERYLGGGNKFMIYFEIWQLLLYSSVLVIKPMYAALPTSMILRIRLFPEISTVLDMLSWLTIIFTFFNGYIIHTTRTIVLEPKRIAWHYVSGVYFTCDVLSSIPIFPTIYFHQVLYKTRVSIFIGVLYLLCQLKLIRIVSVIQYINSIAIYCRIRAKERVFLVMCIVLTMFTVHNCALLELLIPKLIKGYFSRNGSSHLKWFIKYGFHKRSMGVLYSTALFRSSACILAVRTDIISKDSEAEDYVLAVFIYVVGKILICTTYVILAVTLMSSQSMKVKFHSIIDQLDEYMRQKQLPLNLRDKLKKYYNFKYQGRYFKEAMIHDMLPVKLKTDVNLYLCRSLVMSVSIFSDLTADQIGNVVELLIPQIFLPNDTIFQHGTYGDSMYFIASGTVAIYTHSGREVCHLEDGAYFGEIAMVLRIPQRTATVIAVETTQVFVLKRKDFAKSLLKNATVMEKIQRVAQKRLRLITKFDEEYKKMLFERVHGRFSEQVEK